MNKSIVIVGAGHAAAELVSALRQQGWQGGIILIGEEVSLPYQRPPLSKAYLQNQLNSKRLLIKPLTAYEKANIEVRLNRKVISIDREVKQVLLSDGDVVE